MIVCRHQRTHDLGQESGSGVSTEIGTTTGISSIDGGNGGNGVLVFQNELVSDPSMEVNGMDLLRRYTCGISDSCLYVNVATFSQWTIFSYSVHRFDGHIAELHNLTGNDL